MLISNLTQPTFLTALDFRPGGFIFGLLFFLLLLLLWRPLKIGSILDHSRKRVTRFTFIGAALSFLPISAILIVLNYLNVIENHQRIVIIGPLLFILGLACLLILFTNWKWLSRPYQILTLLWSVIALSFLFTMLMKVTWVNLEPFDLTLLLGSWIKV